MVQIQPLSVNCGRHRPERKRLPCAVKGVNTQSKGGGVNSSWLRKRGMDFPFRLCQVKDVG